MRGVGVFALGAEGGAVAFGGGEDLDAFGGEDVLVEGVEEEGGGVGVVAGAEVEVEGFGGEGFAGGRIDVVVFEFGGEVVVAGEEFAALPGGPGAGDVGGAVEVGRGVGGAELGEGVPGEGEGAAGAGGGVEGDGCAGFDFDGADAEGGAGDLENDIFAGAVGAEEDFGFAAAELVRIRIVGGKGGGDDGGGDLVGDALAESVEVADGGAGVVVEDVAGLEACGAGGGVGFDFGDEDAGGGGVLHFGEDGLVLGVDVGGCGWGGVGGEGGGAEGEAEKEGSVPTSRLPRCGRSWQSTLICSW